jgi:hypothetical protein
MPRPSLDLTLTDVLLMLGTAVTFLWLNLLGTDLRARCADAALAMTGYLRPRPDPAAEAVLRSAFAELDGELAAILGDRRKPRGGR